MTFRAISATALAAALVAAAACSNEPAPQSQPPATSSAQPQPGASPAMAPSHSHDAPVAQATSGTTQAPATRKRYDGPLPPLPTPGFTPPRSPEIVKATYEFAARRPDVMQYIPCFCGCQRSGHSGNDDCFVSSRDASGRPTWDLHGMG